jgi:N-sulfoglucosamine sulfohydrolase
LGPQRGQGPGDLVHDRSNDGAGILDRVVLAPYDRRRCLGNDPYRTGIVGKLHINPEEAFPFDMHEIKTANFARENLGNYAKFAEAFICADDGPFFLSVNYPDAHGPWLKQVDGLPENPLEPDDVQAFAYLGIDPPPMREAIANHYNCMGRLDALVGDLAGESQTTSSSCSNAHHRSNQIPL